ncbi:unnamed protein product [Nezara viridula]|uniref:Uncharacterized protein n=1 Tax=Nezara viridula TaxID=85310 RepID=A0A9P0H429_NEZVI|nr:unnamed protein product [Nezara viridula]
MLEIHNQLPLSFGRLRTECSIAIVNGLDTATFFLQQLPNKKRRKEVQTFFLFLTNLVIDQ